MSNLYNPVTYFEIPVLDCDRAIDFYKAVFAFDFDMQHIDGNMMALFPFYQSGMGISGALAQGESYIPSKNGCRLYFGVDNIDAILASVLQFGGEVLYPKTDIGDLGFVAEFLDSEGNRIALSQQKA